MKALRGRKYQIIAAAAIVVVLAAACVGTLMDNGPDLPVRYIQHEQAQQLADLPEADRIAASSTNTDAATFASHLPVVSIDTGGQEIPGEWVAPAASEPDGTSEAGEEDAAFDATRGEGADAIDADLQDIADVADGGVQAATLAPDGMATIKTTFSLFNHTGAANRLSDDPELTSQAEVRIRGNSSRLFDKKSYAVKFTEGDRIVGRDLDVLGMGADSDWALNGPFVDKSLMRNYLSMNLAGQFMSYTPEVRFCELFIDGAYQGVYVLMETIKHGDSRVNLSDSDPKYADTSYLVRRDWEDPTKTTNIYDFLDGVYKMPDGIPLEVRYPNEQFMTEEQLEWITKDLNKLEKALYSYDYDTSSFGYWNNLDVQSFIDYAIINEFSNNVDMGTRSTYYYKDVRGKLTAGPVWDFNNAYDNDLDVDPPDVGFLVFQKPMYYMLFKDEDFTDRFIDRYRDLRQGALSAERIDSIIDGAQAYLGPAVERNYAVWGYSFDPTLLDGDNKLVPDERNPRNYDEAVAQLKDYIHQRGAWMDEHIDAVRQFSHESVNKKFNH